ncbi:MAG: DMT family transporter [Prolixibacteraceae bacterium]
MTEPKKAILYGSVAVLSWSMVATMFKVALRSFSSFEMLLVSSLTALLIFAVVLTWQKKWRLIKGFGLNDWRWFALVGLLNPVAYYLIILRSYELLPAQIAQPVNYSWTVFLLIVLAVYTSKRIPKLKFVGMGISMFGVAMISFGPGSLKGVSFSYFGLFLAFFSAFIWAIYWVVKTLNTKTDHILALFMIFLFGSAYLLASAFVVGVDLHSREGLIASISAGVFEMAIPFIFFGAAIQKSNNPALINQMCYLSPFLSLLFIHIFLGEQIYITTFLGLTLIIAGIMFNEYLINVFQSVGRREG